MKLLELTLKPLLRTRRSTLPSEVESRVGLYVIYCEPTGSLLKLGSAAFRLDTSLIKQ
jgi:hypothetical protein